MNSYRCLRGVCLLMMLLGGVVLSGASTGLGPLLVSQIKDQMQVAIKREPILTDEELRELDAMAVFGGVEDKLFAGDAHALGAAPSSNVKTAVKWYREASELGSGMGSLLLGRMHEKGQGVEQSYEEARKYYELAVQRGETIGNFWMGILYFEGWGVEPDGTKGASLMKLAAEGGFVPAMQVLSHLHVMGRGVPKDTDAALEWAKRAAMQKEDAVSDTLVGVMYRVRLKEQREKTDMLAAREWYGLAAEENYTQAMLAMAETFADEDGEADPGLARQWLELAVEGGDGYAAFVLADMELDLTQPGSGDEDKAKQWLEQGARLRNRHAVVALVKMSQGMPIRKAMQYVQGARRMDYFKELYNALVLDEGYTGTRGAILLEAAEPRYPHSLILSREDGEVRLVYKVDTEGKVRDIQVQSTTHPAFAQSAVEALETWEYEPALKNGRRVEWEMWYDHVFVFPKTKR